MYRVFAFLALTLSLFPACNGSELPQGSAVGQERPPAETPPVEAAAESGQPQVPEVESVDAERLVKAGAVRFTAPKSWVRQQPRSTVISAEFKLPRAEGDEQDGRLTLSLAGGSVKANVERWRSQFGNAPANETKDEVTMAGATVTVVDFSGTYNDQRGPFAPAQKREGYRMMGAIIPVEGQLHFVKAYGPQKTMEQHAQSFRDFLQTLSIDSP
jgi:hypothetical protein